MNSFGWRVGPLIFGTLLVLVTIRLVRRVSRSTLIGGLAGLLLAFDGLAFVMSRTALLDIFVAFFVVAAVTCLAADRDWFRNRLADHLEQRGLPDLGGRFGPALVVRPWRLAAGLCFGLALGSKWNALYVLAAFALLSLAWDVGRPPAGRRRRPQAYPADPARRHSRVRLARRAGRGRLPAPPGPAGSPPPAATTATGAPTTRTPGRSASRRRRWPR